jgi:2-oxoglutarate dehydrogenase E2 component (dihydrolipoamide succinyltransferase)
VGVKAEIKVPAVGESISEATIGEWTKKSGEFVSRDEIILLLETDKASVEVVAPNDGVLTTMAKAGDVVKIGAVVASIDTEGVATAGMAQPDRSVEKPAAAAPQPAGAVAAEAAKSIHPDLQKHLSPAVSRVVNERGLDASQIQGTGKDGRLTKHDAMTAPAAVGATALAPAAPAPQAKKTEIPALPVKSVGTRGERRVPMTTIRKRTAERLVQSQATTATLTTFNEIDMTAVNAIREKYKDKFKEKYGISLGFMGFFVKATVEALKAIPQVNAFIDGTDLVYHDYMNIGCAVSTDKGLMVPVIKNADQMTVAEIELAIRHYALKARENKISIDDLSGGTFTISNGGVFGSLMSTPILNPPQSGILGMHKVEDRPVVVNGQIVIRPMMYVALSYDHRVIDGRESVGFLVKIKEGVEDPARLLLEL